MKRVKKSTYNDIQDYVKEKYNITIKDCWVAHVKEICGLSPKPSPNRIDIKKRKYPCPEDKQEIVIEAFKKVGWID